MGDVGKDNRHFAHSPSMDTERNPINRSFVVAPWCDRYLGRLIKKRRGLNGKAPGVTASVPTHCGGHFFIQPVEGNRVGSAFAVWKLNNRERGAIGPSVGHDVDVDDRWPIRRDQPGTGSAAYCSAVNVQHEPSIRWLAHGCCKPTATRSRHSWLIELLVDYGDPHCVTQPVSSSQPGDRPLFD